MTDAALPADADDSRAPRSAAEIEREIGRSRRRIGLTLDALAQRLAPRRLLQKGLDMTSRLFAMATPTAADIAGKLRAPPLALGLIGAGIAWLVADNIGRLLRRQPAGAGGAPRAGLGNGEIPESGETIAIGNGAVADDSGGDHLRPADVVAGNPLLIGLLCLGAGAALAALLPSSRGEQQLLAPAREDAWQAAETLGHRLAARLRDFGRCSAAATAEPPAAE
jgi:hypothetical protein